MLSKFILGSLAKNCLCIKSSASVFTTSCSQTVVNKVCWSIKFVFYGLGLFLWCNLNRPTLFLVGNACFLLYLTLMAIPKVTTENINPFTKRFTKGKPFLSNIYLQCLWICPSLVNSVPPGRCEPILGRGGSSATQSCAPQGATAPPRQPKIAVPAAGLRCRESPGEC